MRKKGIKNINTNEAIILKAINDRTLINELKINSEDVVKCVKLAKNEVYELEKLVKQYLNPKASKNNTPPQQSIELKELINEMQRVFATKVSAIGSDKKGRIYIDYYSKDDLDRISELLELLKTKTLTLKDLSNFNKRG